MRDNMCLFLLVLVVGFTYIKAAVPQQKRHGMFGLCRGWGAGCSFTYRQQNRTPSKLPSPKSSPSSRNARYNVPSFIFTSGTSWNPIGKRSAWFTDIPYLRSPLISLLALKKPKDNKHYAEMFPLVFRHNQVR
ncbi:uncharacterized protein [Argopecten irradians]|uniref:uncharacterized protein n=1 Tax=Argopecten irradians TaxID=31199 RepID=UPI003722CA2E